MKKIIFSFLTILILSACQREDLGTDNAALTEVNQENLVAKAGNGRVLRDLSDIFRGSYDAYYPSSDDRFKLLGHFDKNLDAISVFFKKLPLINGTAAYHMYILCYDHRRKIEWIYRAGPAAQPDAIHTFVYILTGATPPPIPGVQSFGHLTGQVGLNRPYELKTDPRDPSKKVEIGSIDFDGQQKNIGVVVKVADNLTNIFNSFEASDAFINDLKVRYNPYYPNSNSYVTTLLKRANLLSAKEAIDSYPSNTPNKQYFTNLFTPGAFVIDLNNKYVVTDNRKGRNLQNLTQAQSKAISDKLKGERTTLDNMTNDHYYDDLEYDLVKQMALQKSQMGLQNIRYAPRPAFIAEP
ncbi:membrane lipoprotein lipid attachment site-containing protein [Chryseobacterium sp.]|uniref:membrane lipoprotein lipid attachment site-containing protein n=1 Tax=Chryseobacterium sp. TaxID=1871047 RepID=UPI0025C5EC71|nr:membrane lipoprotein lipid attachment site-containing protein [Chryseobacterium sp.]